MNITIIGNGYVGLVTGACLADMGNAVLCLDVDARKIDMINRNQLPIHEPGLQEIVERNRAAGRLSFSTDVSAGVRHGSIQFIVVGTPSNVDGSADCQYVLNAAHNIGRYMDDFKVVVNKSTVPVGTARRVHAAIADELEARGSSLPFSVVSNPEFLKEGAAIDDFMHPDRIVLGCDNDQYGARAREQMSCLYAPFNRHHNRILYMDVHSAEFTKYAANAMLATRVSLMNEFANLAERVGADIEAVRLGIGADRRIGYEFLHAGCGYGGLCLPKDVRALIRTASEHGQQLHILSAVEAVNQAQKQVLVEKIIHRLGADLSSRKFAVWGLAFKPNTDDMREAPSRALIKALLLRGATVSAYDPAALEEAKRVFALDLKNHPEASTRLQFADDQMQALNGADALLIVSEWETFKNPDFERLRKRLKIPLIFDGRNLYDPATLSELNIEYYAIGRMYIEPSGQRRSRTGLIR